MKKFNLKLGGIKEMLTKEQMKKITGGYLYGYEGNCVIECYAMNYSGPQPQRVLMKTASACGCHTGEYHRHCQNTGPYDLYPSWECIGSDCYRGLEPTPWCGPYTN